MQKITKRQKQIAEFLLKNGQTPCSTISQNLAVSNKTIRTDIHSMNQLFGNEIICSNRDGFYVADNKADTLIREIKQVSEDSDRKLLRYLLLKEKPDDFYEIADKLYISPTALQAKVKHINKWIGKYSLEIRRLDSRLRIFGNEYDRQKLYLDLLYQDVGQMFQNLQDYSDFFPGIDIGKATTIIKKAVTNHSCYIPPYYETNVIINILTVISLYRDHPDNLEQSVENSPAADIAAQIVSEIMPENPDRHDLINMIRFCFSGIMRTEKETILSSQPYSDEYEKRLMNIVKNSFENFGIHVDTPQFMAFFPEHVYNLIQRIQSGNYCSFPQNDNIQTSCMYIYDVAVYLCEQLNKEFNIRIPENEISLIAMHIGFAIESYFSQTKRINVLLSSGGYPIVDEYITNTILEQFSDQVNLIKSNNLRNGIPGSIDLIITTTSYLHGDNTKCCTVSPFLTDTDKNKIEHSIVECLEQKKKQEFTSLIRQYFDPDLFFLDKHLTTRDSVLSFLTSKLCACGAVEPSFLESVIYRESLNPTCFMNTFAIPHSFQAEALQNKIAVLINNHGISWDTQEIKLVFLIATDKRATDSQKILLDGLGTLLGNSSILAELLQATNYEEFLSILTR